MKMAFLQRLSKDLKSLKRSLTKQKNMALTKKDIIIDCLVLTASAQQKKSWKQSKAVSMVKTLGVHTVLGVSNVSFGLPNRPLLNKNILSNGNVGGT